MRSLFGFTLVGMGVLASGMMAQAAPPRMEVRFTSHPPKVDGVIDEAAWKEAAPVWFPAGKAVPSGGSEAALASGEIRMLWTRKGLYLAFRALDRTPVFGHSAPGDPLYEEDVFEIFIDAVGDHLQYSELQMDPAARAFVMNYVLTAPPRLSAKNRFSREFIARDLWRYPIPVPPDVRIASRIDPETHLWTLEAFLPASFVNRRRGKPLEPGVWRANFVRHDWATPKGTPHRKPPRFLYWAPVFEGSPHLSPTMMGYLVLKK